ncbi:helix-turn-helix transcriptional regulator [Sporomusa sp. KB1]|uniref:helix-turn-helix domain-containing protein n=1 Tax=Sporomusa sp. KB1 TaxID=943346 RepID=UPI0011AA0AFE|nr:helix-turn-helix transcriptional regulator [Sporomusa sp. KB1]TWH48502.1 helix-turn-helix protein [Sporomusa sp. KB1]
MSILTNLEIKYNLKPIEMAKELGISKSYYSMLRSGDRPISKNIAIQLKNQFGVKFDDSLCPAVHVGKTEKSDQQPTLPRTG